MTEWGPAISVFLKNIHLFIWLHRVLVVAREISVAVLGLLIVVSGLSSCGMRA